MYQKVSTDMNFAQREKEIAAFWEADQTFRKSLERPTGQRPFGDILRA